MTTTARIKKLDESTIVKIAAGEVIERPASVVKELVENSLDAGAKNIVVRIEKGGLGLIEVADDGCGISAAELPIAIERHATSKIGSSDDLERVSTMGFRGEALAAIASAGRLSIVTKSQDGDGAKLTLGESWRSGAAEGMEVTPAGRAQGTSVMLRDLFAGIPARLKFMKSESSEFSKIADVCERIALARPDVSIELIRDGKRVMRTPGVGGLREAVSALFGVDAARELIEVFDFSGGVRVRGLISPPHMTKKNRTGFHYNLAARPIEDKTIHHAIAHAYEGLIPHGEYPIVYLTIEVPSGEVDVNVHPAKAEVRFRDPSSVHRVLHQALRQRLRGRVEAPSATAFELASESIPPEQRVFQQPVLSALFDYESKMPVTERSAASTEEIVAPMERVELSSRGEIAGRFILAEGSDGLYIIDQHAAHERILFDRLMTEAQASEVQVAPLLTPFVIDASASERAIAESAMSILNDIGIEIEVWPDSIAVKAMPAIFPGIGAAQDVIRDVIETMKSSGAAGEKSRIPYERAARAACKAAVKGTERMSSDERAALLKDLMRTTDPYTCPHGRPTMIKLTIEDLDRKFRRL